MKWIFTLLMVAGALLGRAEAQSAPWQQERLTPGWTFTPGAAVGGLWDSNVTVRNQGSTPVSEWVGAVSPRGELDFNGRHSRVSGSYSGTLHAYRTLEALTRYDQRVRASARHQPTARLSLQSQFAATLTPTTEDLEISGLPYVRLGSRLYTSRGGAVYTASDRTSLAVDYTAQRVSFERAAVVDFHDLRGGSSHGGSVGLTRRLDRRLSTGGSWQYIRSQLTDSDVTAHMQRIQGEIGWQLAPSTSVAGSAGIAHLRVPSVDASQVGPAFGAAINHVKGRLRLTARYEQAFSATYAFGSAISHRTASASAYLPLMRGRMFVSGSAGVHRSTPTAGAVDVITLDSVLASTTVGFHASRWLRVEGFYLASFQDSSARGHYDRSRIGFQLVTSKPLRIQ
jgi:hypothetical protein